MNYIQVIDERNLRKLTMLKRILLGLGVLALSTVATAQTNFADFRAKVMQNGKAVSGVEVKMILNDIEVATDTTDSDGRVGWPNLTPGEYKIVATKNGQSPIEVSKYLVAGNNPEYTIDLAERMQVIELTAKRTQKKPVDLLNNRVGFTQDELLNSAGRGVGLLENTNSAILSTPAGLSIRGSRPDGNGYFVDGMRIIGGGATPPTLGTQELAATISGIPANVGDLTGGAFQSTTRSATRKTTTAMEMNTSQFLDAFGISAMEGFISGPVWIKNKGKKNEYVKLGYVANAQVSYAKDPGPTRTGVYVVKEDVLNQIEQDPLVFTPNGFVHRASYLREDDFERLKARPNSAQYGGNVWGKLEFRPSSLITMTLYGQYVYGGGRAATNSIMNYKNSARSDGHTYRGYFQFVQNFKTDKESSIKNAFYTIRAEYQNTYSFGRDANHLDNIFDYGYIGKFTAHPTAFFQYANYDPQQNPNKEPRIVQDQYGNYVQLRNYWEQVGFADTLLTFEASNLNPIRARYTQNIYDYFASRGAKIANSNQVQVNQGLLNGFNPNSVYSLHGTPGGITSGWSKSMSERYSVFAQGQMQYKPKTENGIERAPHDLQAGFYYEQQFSRGYGLSANNLWILMRQLMNSHILELDIANPILSYDANGVFTDTVRYNRLLNSASQTSFDKAFREKLISEGRTDVYGNKIDERTFVDINSYAPGDFDINMFTADELLNNGNSYVSYFGYDHLGNRLNGKPSINEFFDPSKRMIGAFQPVYTAAWVQDQFQFKDLIFRLGLRMERYDANQLVLDDPYSLYPIRTAAEVTSINGLDVAHPDNIGDNFKVYVNDITAPTKILGYRNGDRWFNADGSELKSPEILANQTSNGRIAPYLVNPNQKDIESSSLRDFTPVVNLLPRVYFSFPLVPRKKTFYVIYDVLAQRPNSGASFLSIDELYYLKFRQGNTISNGDLKPRLKTDYEVGFKQLSGVKEDRGLELAAFYTEVRNDFGLYQITQGYPVTYITYRNIDFSTISGFRAEYRMFGIGGKGNIPGPFNFNASYMMQFADGTGSNINSQATLIASNQPNLRNVIPLGELDIRHNIKLMVTLAWMGGRDPKTKQNLYIGPKVGNKEIFKNTSFSVISNSYSGTPYTPTTRPVQIGAVDRAQIKGVPFGARLPWNQQFDVQVRKQFRLNRESKDPLKMAAFLLVSNITNRMNVVGVFPYTGQPQDDGFLNSPQGQLLAKNQIDAQSYIDLYRVLLNSQTGNLGAPRTLRFGLQVFFN
jgi:hypothetical protein